MKTKVKKEYFETRISIWLGDILHFMDENENFNEKTLSLIMNDNSEPTAEEKEFTTKLLHQTLSLSFILDKNRKELEDFQNYWNK